MQFSDIRAVDAHGHYGQYLDVAQSDLTLELSSPDVAEVARRAANCGIEWTIVSSHSGIFPRGGTDALR